MGTKTSEAALRKDSSSSSSSSIPRLQMIVPVLVPAQAPAQAPARAQVLARHTAVPAQVQAFPLQVAPALVQAQNPQLQTALVPAHLKVNPTVTTNNMTHTDQ